MNPPSLAEVEHADWPSLQRICASLGVNPKGRSEVVRMRVLDHLRRRVREEVWRPGAAHAAALLSRLGHSDGAIRLWESTIQLDEPAPWVGLGSAQLTAGDLTQAAKDFDRAIQMGAVAANLHRAESLAAAGNYEGAVRACDAYLASRPLDLRGVLLKAGFLARGGWTDEAATVLRDAFEAHPETRELWQGLGTLLLRGRRYEAAAEAYRESLRGDPKDAASWVNRGSALLLAGRTHEAIGVLRETLEADPHQPVALNNLGVAYLRAGQSRSALINLERAAKHMETPQILMNVAKVQEAAHQRAEALASYARLLALNPRDAEALAARKRLQPRRPPRRGATRGARKAVPQKRTVRGKSTAAKRRRPRKHARTARRRRPTTRTPKRTPAKARPPRRKARPRAGAKKRRPTRRRR